MASRAGRAQGIARAVLTPTFRFLWKVTTEGLENVPAEGGALVAPNHISVLDSFFVPLVLPRRITYVGKAEYMDDWKTKYVFPAIGMIPIDRSGGDSSTAALDAAAGVLERGELFGIYPEGTRSRDGRLHKGHTGIARLALRTGCPIVPVGIIGSDEIQPPDVKAPRPFRRVHLRFGRPVDVGRYLDRRDDRLVLRQITDEVMFEIRNLSGQEYVDTYATAKKAPAPATGPVVVATESAPGDGTSSDEGGELAEVVRIDRPAPAAAFAPSAAPAAALVGAGGPPSDDEGGEVGERRSSSAVMRSRPLDLAL